MSEKRAPYSLGLVRDALGQSGIDEGLKLSQGARIGARDVPAGEGDLWLENSIRFSTALSAGVTVASFTMAVSTSWQPVTFDTEAWDSDDIADLGTYPTRLTINSEGVYQAHGYGLFATSASNLRGIGIRLNGATILGGWSQPNQTITNHAFASALWKFVESDYIELVVYQDLGVTQNIAPVYFTIARVP